MLHRAWHRFDVTAFSPRLTSCRSSPTSSSSCLRDPVQAGTPGGPGPTRAGVLTSQRSISYSASTKIDSPEAPPIRFATPRYSPHRLAALCCNAAAVGFQHHCVQDFLVESDCKSVWPPTTVVVPWCFCVPACLKHSIRALFAHLTCFV